MKQDLIEYYATHNTDVPTVNNYSRYEKQKIINNSVVERDIKQKEENIIGNIKNVQCELMEEIKRLNSKIINKKLDINEVMEGLTVVKTKVLRQLEETRDNILKEFTQLLREAIDEVKVNESLNMLSLGTFKDKDEKVENMLKIMEKKHDLMLDITSIKYNIEECMLMCENKIVIDLLCIQRNAIRSLLENNEVTTEIMEKYNMIISYMDNINKLSENTNRKYY